jgi:DNA-binding MarR family transcriptional regulator
MPETTSRLQRELHQRKPFRSLAHEAVLGLVRTADLSRRHFEAMLEPHGITGTQYNVLRILRGAGTEGIPTLDVADRMVEMAPGITRLLDRLEAKGLVRRERCADDRRRVLCWATPKALRLLAALDAPVDASENEQMSPLSDAEKRELIRLLDTIRAGLGA